MTEQKKIDLIHEKGGYYLAEFEEEDITYNMCLAAIDEIAGAIVYVPEKYQKDDICRLAVCKDPKLFKSVPECVITAEFVVQVARTHSMNSISFLPKSKKNAEFYSEIVLIEPELLWHIPKKNHTVSVCMNALSGMDIKSVSEAVKENPFLISQLHTSLYDHDSCIQLVMSEIFQNAIDEWGYENNNDGSGLLLLDYDRNYTCSLKHILQWKDVIEHVVEINGELLEYVKPKLMTIDICKKAVMSNSKAVAYVTAKYLTDDLVDYALNDRPELIEVIPPQFLTLERCINVVKKQGTLLCYVPIVFRTKEVCALALNYPSEPECNLKYVPEEILDKDLILIYLKNNCLYKLDFIPTQLLDYEVCMTIVKKVGFMLGKVPDQVIDYEMCLSAIPGYYGMDAYIPKHFFTQELVNLVFSNMISDIKNIPEEYLNEDLYIKAVTQKSAGSFGRILKDIPDANLTQRICDIAVECTPHSLKYVPDRFVTAGILKSVANQACGLLKDNFPERFRNKEFIEELIKIEPNCKYYFDEYLTEE